MQPMKWHVNRMLMKLKRCIEDRLSASHVGLQVAFEIRIRVGRPLNNIGRLQKSLGLYSRLPLDRNHHHPLVLFSRILIPLSYYIA